MEVDKLPIEIWMNILTRLDNKDLSNCKLTCSAFNELINTERFWIQFAKENEIELSEILPPKNWIDAARNNQFEGNISIDSSRFKFDYRKIVNLEKGYSESILFQFNNFQTMGNLRQIFDVTTNYRAATNANLFCWLTDSIDFSAAFIGSLFIYKKFSEVGIDNWVMDHVRPKIKIAARIWLPDESTFTMIAELNYEKGYFKHGKQIINVSKDNKRRKELEIAYNSDEPEDWKYASIEFDDYPSGLRSVSFMIKADSSEYDYIDYPRANDCCPSISHIYMKAEMPENAELKEFKEDDEDIETRRYCEECERYMTNWLNHDCDGSERRGGDSILSYEDDGFDF